MVKKSHDDRADAPSTQVGWAFPKDQYAALEEVRKVLALSQEEMNLFLAILKKSVGAEISFEIGDTSITFGNVEYCDDLKLIIKVERGNVTSCIEYSLNDYDACKSAIVDSEN